MRQSGNLAGHRSSQQQTTLLQHAVYPYILLYHSASWHSIGCPTFLSCTFYGQASLHPFAGVTPDLQQGNKAKARGYVGGFRGSPVTLAWNAERRAAALQQSCGAVRVLSHKAREG